MKHTLKFQFLKSFFFLFKARIVKYKIDCTKIIGTIGWVDEDDKQDFCWNFDINNNDFSNSKLLNDYLNDNNLVNGDHIVISENSLLLKLIGAGWKEKDAQKSIEYLCSVEVKMLDEEEETDSFFIHF